MGRGFSGESGLNQKDTVEDFCSASRHVINLRSMRWKFPDYQIS